MVIIGYNLSLCTGSYLGISHLLHKTSADFKRCPIGSVTLNVALIPTDVSEIRKWNDQHYDKYNSRSKFT